MTAIIPELLDLLKAGVHFGHKTSRWHPKMKPFIFGERGGVHIVNLEQTQEKLKEALDFIKNLGKEGKVLLFVGTKKQAAAIISKCATECGMPYVEHRWLGGTITNWTEIFKLIKKYVDLKGQQEKGGLQKYTKKEQSEFAKDIARMSQLVGGISTLTKIPDAIFIIDIKREETVVREANQKGVPVIALCDTNVNAELVQYPIPGNDDALKSIELITQLVAQAYKEGVEERNAAKVTETTKTAEAAEVK